MPSNSLQYAADNAAYRTFRVALATAKALTFALVGETTNAVKSFLETSSKALRESDVPDTMIAMRGPHSNRLGYPGILSITSDEIQLVESQPGGFKTQALALVYREIHGLTHVWWARLMVMRPVRSSAGIGIRVLSVDGRGYRRLRCTQTGFDGPVLGFCNARDARVLS